MNSGAYRTTASMTALMCAMMAISLGATPLSLSDEDVSEALGYEEILETVVHIDAPVEEGDSVSWLERFGVLVADLQSQQVVFDEDEALTLLSRTLLEWIDPEGGEFTPERAEQIRRRRQGYMYDPGFGIEISDQYLRIGEFRDDIPEATREVLQEGFRVVEMDGQALDRTGLVQAHNMLRSRHPSPLQLVFLNADNDRVTQSVERVSTQLDLMEWEEVLPFDLGYLKVNRLHESSGGQIADILKSWSDHGLNGGILDLRGADGGDLESVREVASLFVEERTFLFAFRDRDDHDLMVMEAETGTVLGKPVMVLMDAQTGGAAEVLAAVLADSVRGAMLFGQPSRGDFLLRSRIELSSGIELYLPTRRLITGSGAEYDGDHGVNPDIITAEADGAFRAARSGRTARIAEEVAQEKLHHRIRGDATLRRAVDVLVGLKALDMRPYGTTTNYSR